MPSHGVQQNMEDSTGEYLTTNQGVRINDDQNSLKAGERGPSLLEDILKVRSVRALILRLVFGA